MTLDADRVGAFYAFMREREAIRLRRLRGLPREEWTTDPIFRTYSFTNVKREHDRVSTQLRKELYAPNFNPVDAAPWPERSSPAFDLTACANLLRNCATYRLFGTIASARAIGYPTTWDSGERARIGALGAAGRLSFTSAYIVPALPGHVGRPKYESVIQVVDEVWSEGDELINEPGWRSRAITGAMLEPGWQRATELLTKCRGIGSFLAKEILLDYVMATRREPPDWQTWTPVGPGGIRGSMRVKYGVAEPVINGSVRRGEAEALDVIREVYAARAEHWPTDGVQLDLTDIQFQMCEFDKYSRVAEGRKPKRLFRPTEDKITKETAQ